MSACLKSTVVLVVAVLSFGGCGRETATGTQAEAARAVVDEFWRAIGEQDVDLLTRIVAKDDAFVAFGTDAAERWVGSEAFLTAEGQMMQAFDVESLSRREETFQMHPREGVAWFSTVFDLEILVNGELSRLEGLRTTGVIEQRGDDWVIVQLHTSVPVAGQEIEY